jgi:hypothetical protein
MSTITIVPATKPLHSVNVKDYRNQMRHFIMTSRFNTNTWNENEKYRTSHTKIGCIYGSPCPISINIPHESIMFILEMNNDTNKISGIGMVRNKPQINKNKVYESGNYNRYSFMGKCRIDREQMTDEEKLIMCVFDILCFTGNRHMKRGQGLTSFPVDMLYRCHRKLDLIEFIRDMFKARYTK